MNIFSVHTQFSSFFTYGTPIIAQNNKKYFIIFIQYTYYTAYYSFIRIKSLDIMNILCIIVFINKIYKGVYQNG